MIGLFGGSFDPIHHGHLIVARSVFETLGLAELRFVVAREQPFKLGQHRAPPEARARMVELAIAGDPALRLERIELEREGPSYTVDTLRALRAREPGAAFALLVGADAAQELPQWREAETLHRLATLVLVARPGVVLPRLPWAVRSVTVPAIEISATEVRQRVRAGLPIRYWVPDAVAAYIASEGLYRAR
ncbi:MAG TPA: nicotinate-nucleotide adenylyltransferase [Gemmatimonadales bacterium]|nr:nicotinate-nucleotide adenylyltransferase [Gemmatimonadales bacterium]